MIEGCTDECLGGCSCRLGLGSRLGSGSGLEFGSAFVRTHFLVTDLTEGQGRPEGEEGVKGKSEESPL